MKRTVLVLVILLLLPARAASADAPPPTDPVTTENPFLPENEDVTDCISALPQPGCGSDERGEWIQFVILGVVVLGLVFIGWRITRAVRARDRASSVQ